MHAICGAWACLFVGLLAKEEYVMEVGALHLP
jgi:ammonia channel protein AmtB